MKQKAKEKKENAKWWEGKPFVALQYFLMKHEVYWGLSSGSKEMYSYMRMQYKDYSPPVTSVNKDMSRIPFGPSCMPKISSTKYYASLSELTKKGFVKIVEEGGHGKKAIYDLTTMDWVVYDGKGKNRGKGCDEE